jgi:biopolymer transport protein TolR
MAGFVGKGGGGGLRAEINVTPLVDVVLVLLIIFMVVTPMLTRGKNVQLPIAAAADAKTEASQDAIVLTITADKRLWLETQKVSDKELVKELKERLAETPGIEILIKADSAVSVRDLRPVLQKLKLAGASQIAFAVLEQARGTK